MDCVAVSSVGKYCRIEVLLPERFVELLDEIIEYSKHYDLDYHSRDTALWFAVEELNQRVKREAREEPERGGMDGSSRDDARCDSMRQMPYKDYLQTSFWQLIREWIIEKRGAKCQICNSTENINVHHRSYENLGDEREEDLVVLCQSCHEIFHKNGKLAKREG